MTDAAVELALPFAGRWAVQNSPARRVPSHGTDLMGELYAIDFVAVAHSSPCCRTCSASPHGRAARSPPSQATT